MRSVEDDTARRCGRLTGDGGGSRSRCDDTMRISASLYVEVVQCVATVTVLNDDDGPKKPDVCPITDQTTTLAVIAVDYLSQRPRL